MKITVYTTTDCQFSKDEKQYLTAKNLVFEEKNLETNREFLTEMMSVSNNFAGTPVTKIEKDDGQIVVLKGFTKEEFDKSLGFEEKPAEPVAATPPTPAPVVAEPAAPAPIPVTPPANPSTPDPLKSVLDDLEAKAAPVTPAPEPVIPPAPVTPPVVEATPPPAETPTTPPSIPDFKPQL